MKFLLSIVAFIFSFNLLIASEVPLADSSEIKFNSRFIEANKQKMLGNNSEAMDLFFQCLDIVPTSGATMFEISRLLVKSDDISGAIAMLEKAMVNSPDNTVYKNFIVQLYLEVNRMDEAIEVLQQLIELKPYDLENYLNLGSIYVSQNKYKKAKKFYESTYEIFGDEELLIDEMLKCELIFSHYDNVLSQLSKLINDYPSDPRYPRILAETYIHLKRYDNAIAVYDSLLKVDLDTTNIHLSKLDLFILMNDQDRFLKELHFIFNDPSIDVSLKIETLMRLTNGKNSVLSVEQYDEFVNTLYQQHPENLAIRIAYAEYLLKNDKYEEARPHLYFIYNKDKSKYSVYEQLLYIENADQNWDSVQSISSVGVFYFPTNPLFYFYNGFSNIQLGNYELAIDKLLSGLHYVQNPELKVEFYSQIAEAYKQSGSNKLAYQFFEKALQLNPTNAMILNNYSYYLSIDSLQLDKALEMTILSNKLEVDNPVFIDTHAWVLYKMGNYDEALKVIIRAYELGASENAEVVEHIGDIYYALNELDKAEKYWREALLLDESADHLNEKLQKLKSE